MIHDAIRPMKRAIILAARERRRINVPRKTRDMSATRACESSPYGIACRQNVAFFEGDDGDPHRRERKTQTVVIERDGMWTSSRDALSDFAAVRIGSFGTDIVYPGKLTAGSQRGMEERKRDCSPGDISLAERTRAARSCDRSTTRYVAIIRDSGDASPEATE